MREFLILFFALIFSFNSAYALDVVLPNEKKTFTNGQYAFFVGSVRKNEELTINGTKVLVAPNGAFAYTQKLKNGENRVELRSSYTRQYYKIYKNKQGENFKQEEYSFEPTHYVVKKDNTPLRSTPVDFGMNRISHLFEGTNLLVDGEKGDFYRVFLTKNKQAWVAKESVQEGGDFYETPCFVTMNSQTFKNASVHTLEFTDKLPYTIEENGSDILFKVYNPFLSENSVYTVNAKAPSEYSYKTILNNGTYQFKISSLPIPENKTLEGLTIAVDAGHGGSELGAIGCLRDCEKTINLKIAQELQDILTQMGANVVMTRECDANVELQDRVKMAEDGCADIFISIHLNSIPDIEMNVHKKRGTSVFYFNKNSKNLAKFLHDSVTSGLGTRKDGVKTASFAVIRPTDYVGVLVEVAYMTNPLDSVMYREEGFSRKTAQSIADGVVKYVESYSE